LTERHHLATRFTSKLVRVGNITALALLLTAGLAGCHHKAAVVPFPQTAHAPVELESPPPPVSPPLVATVPLPELAPLSAPPPAKPVPKKKPSPREDTQPPAQVASDAAAPALSIGTLSAGGDSTPQSQQQAQDLIASILKRIAALPAKTADATKVQIKQIRNFLDQAQRALSSGDPDGARNLATKAKLLLDELEKK